MTTTHTWRFQAGKSRHNVTEAEVAKCVENGGQSCHQCGARTLNMPCANLTDR